MGNGITADRRIDFVLTGIENTHLSKVMNVARNLPVGNSERFHDEEDLSGEVFGRAHGEENLESIATELDGQATGVRCEECGEEWVVA